MTTRFGWHGRLGVALGLTASLAIAAPAVAAPTVKLSGGTTTLKLDAKTSKALKKAGIKVSAATPGKLKGGSLSLAVSGGSIDPATAKGTIDHKGGITLKMGKKKLTLASPTFNTSKGTVTVKAGKKKVAFAAIKGGKVARDGFNTSASGFKVSISKAGAAAINKALGSRAVKANAALGTASIAPKTDEIAIERGSTTLLFTPEMAGALQQLRIPVSAGAPATQNPDTSISFPITEGTLKQGTYFGTIEHGGALVLGTTPLANPSITLSATPSLSISGVEVGPLDVSAMVPRIDPATRTIEISNVGVTISDQAAGLLTNLLALPQGVLRGGAKIAVGTLSATAR